MASRKNSIVHLFDDVGPSAAQCDDICNTSTKTAAKAMQVAHYRTQLVTVQTAMRNLPSDDVVYGMLKFLEDCINKIVQVSTACSCQRLEQQAIVNAHKMAFLREENCKFFRLVEEKTEECEKLKLECQSLKEKFTQNQAEILLGNLQTSDRHPAYYFPSCVQTSSLASLRVEESRANQTKDRLQRTTCMQSSNHKKYFNELSAKPNCTSQSNVLTEVNGNGSVDSAKKGKIFRNR